MAIKISDAMLFILGGKKNNGSNVCATAIFPLFWSQDADSSTFFPNVGVHLFNVTMTSPQYEQESLNYSTGLNTFILIHVYLFP